MSLLFILFFISKFNADTNTILFLPFAMAIDLAIVLSIYG
jgi:hypothetical protein